jgi:hypothetical protein
MEKAVPDAKAVAAQARKAVAELDTWLADMQAVEDRGGRVDAGLPRKLVHSLAAQAPIDLDWDALAANYFGCRAMLQASPNSAWIGPIESLDRDLILPRMLGGQEPARMPNRDRARERFRTLFELTPPIGDKR